MKQLALNDGRSLEVQSIEASDGVMHIRMILTTSEQIKAYFMDDFATSVMTLYENGKVVERYENYTTLKSITEELGGIWDAMMLQPEKDPETKIAELEEELASANNQITDLQMAICELYEGMVV